MTESRSASARLATADDARNRAQGGVAVPADVPAPDLSAVRGSFPSLARELDGRPVVYLDGPGGTQVPRATIEAMARYLERSNANHGGAYWASEESDAMLAEAHAAAADFLGAASGRDVVFGPNM